MEISDTERVKRFYAKVNKRGPIPKKHPELGRCWQWTGAKDSNGYGNFTVAKGKTGKAHRFSFLLAFGWILNHPYQVDHKCENTSCVRPSHLICLLGWKNNEKSSSPSAQNKRKTHCKRNHPFTKANTIVDEKGHRRCKACREGDYV